MIRNAVSVCGLKARSDSGSNPEKRDSTWAQPRSSLTHHIQFPDSWFTGNDREFRTTGNLNRKKEVLCESRLSGVGCFHGDAVKFSCSWNWIAVSEGPGKVLEVCSRSWTEQFHTITCLVLTLRQKPGHFLFRHLGAVLIFRLFTIPLQSGKLEIMYPACSASRKWRLQCIYLELICFQKLAQKDSEYNSPGNNKNKITGTNLWVQPMKNQRHNQWVWMKE